MSKSISNKCKRLVITLVELKTEFKIVVKDLEKKEWKEEWKISKENKKGLLEALNDAKSWLWNMGDYNGQANEMMSSNNKSWIEFLGIKEEFYNQNN